MKSHWIGIVAVCLPFALGCGEPPASAPPAEQRLLELAPVIPLYHPTSRCLLAPEVSGYEDNLLNVHLLRYLSLAGSGLAPPSAG